MYGPWLACSGLSLPSTTIWCAPPPTPSRHSARRIAVPPSFTMCTLFQREFSDDASAVWTPGSPLALMTTHFDGSSSTTDIDLNCVDALPNASCNGPEWTPAMPELFATSSTELHDTPSIAERAILSGSSSSPGDGKLSRLALNASAILSSIKFLRIPVGAPANPKSGSYDTAETTTAD